MLFEAQDEKFFGEDGSGLQSEVFQFRQGGSPSRALGSEEIVGQFLGDAFEVGPQGFDLGVKNLGVSLACHPWPPGKGKVVCEREVARIDETIGKEKSA